MFLLGFLKWPRGSDPVLKELDRVLDDDALYQRVRADLGKRYRYTLVHGRHSTPVEVLLRMLICKHLYAWSFKETEERVKDSLVLRWFCRVYFQRVPDSTTLFRWLQTIHPETLHALNDQVVRLARQANVTKGRKLRLDATCVQTNIHHPTDSGLLVRRACGCFRAS
jgi:transposase, IS5 family